MFHWIPPLIVLAAFLVATFWSWQTAQERYNREYDQAVTRNIAAVEEGIKQKMAAYELSLETSAALFGASDEVNRQEWQEFQKTFRHPERFLGVTEVAYATKVNAGDLPAHIKKIRSQGFSNYRVYPKQKSKLYMPVIFPANHVSPKNAHKSRALGYDMYTVDTRRQAMEEAITTNSTILSKKSIVRRSTDQPDEPAFVMFLPVYQRGHSLDSPSQRWSALQGFVYAPLFTNQVFDDIFSKRRDIEVGFEVYDSNAEPGSLLYRSDRFYDNNQSNRFTRTVVTNNHHWQVVYAPDASIVPRNVRRAPLSSLIGGIVFSLLIAGLVWTLLVSRARSITVAEERELQQAKDDVLSIASHQLRTPATGVKQYIGMLQGGFAGKLSKDQQKLLNEAYISNERQLHIIDEMLHVARIDTGQLTLQYETIDLTALVNSIVKDHRQTIQERRQVIKVMARRKHFYVQADGQYLRMALENIIGNASKYTYDGGKISVHLRKQDHYTIVKIEDTGVGIDKKDFPQLFQKFSRIHNELSRQTAGSGVGLYVAKRIIDMHGGYIDFTSNVKQGSSFIVHLPQQRTKKDHDKTKKSLV